MLEITDLYAQAAGKPILKGIDLTVRAGEVHAIMGPNGSGKSTLANALAGQPDVEVTAGDMRIEGTSLMGLPPEERAHFGLFLAFQYPVEIAGVSNMEFLKAAVDSRDAALGREAMSATSFVTLAREAAARLELAAEFLRRGVNAGFSGGEKKRNEILQMLLLKPRLAVLDETDAGLDIGALRTVARGVNAFASDDNAVLLITHYQRLLDHIAPDFVHVLLDGRIVETGDKSLARKLEAGGYAGFAGAKA